MRARNRGANLDVIFPWHVSVWMRTSTVDGHSLPLRRRGRIVVPAGPLAILHLDFVKRWGCDGPGLEPHRTGSGWREWRKCRARLAEHIREMEPWSEMAVDGDSRASSGVWAGCRVSPGDVRRRVEWPCKKTKRAKASKTASPEGGMVRRANRSGALGFTGATAGRAIALD